MKLSFILCFICMLQVFATSYSQTARISLSMHDFGVTDGNVYPWENPANIVGVNNL